MSKKLPTELPNAIINKPIIIFPEKASIISSNNVRKQNGTIKIITSCHLSNPPYKKLLDEFYRRLIVIPRQVVVEEHHVAVQKYV